MKNAIIIPVKNEKRGLSELIQLLRKQISDKDEIIFVDAGSTDGTQEILRQASNDCEQIKLIISPGAFPGKARNIGIQNTDADIIIQIDGGNLPDYLWVNKLSSPVASCRADYAWGNFKILPVMKRVFGLSFDIGKVYVCSFFRDRDSRNSMAGGSCTAYKRWIWEKVGGFPEWTPVAEDKLFAKKVQNFNVKAVFVKDAYIYWQLGPRLIDIIKRQINYQKEKFIHRGEIFQIKWTTLLPLFFLGMIVLSILFPDLFPLTFFILVLYWIRQSFKTFRVYKKLGNKNLSLYIIAIPVVLFIEGIAIFSKIAGSVLGLFYWGKGKDLSKKAYDYLYGTVRE
jgi:glycosyltransferase involved in cell wall biosynthesis